MMLEWFNAREAQRIGTALADQFVLQIAPRSAARPLPPISAEQQSKAIQRLLQQLEHEIRPLQLNFYRRAKLANSFKWRLREKGIGSGIADKLTAMLLFRL